MKQILAYFNQPLLKWSVLFGLAAGLLAFAYFLALYALNVTPLGSHRSLDFGIHVVLITAAVWYYRRRVGLGYLHLWEGLTIGYIVNTVGAFITGWLVYLFIEYADPTVFADYLANSRKLLLQSKPELTKQLGADGFARLLADVARTQPADLITDEIVKKSALAVLPVLIISLLFRKQDYNVLR